MLAVAALLVPALIIDSGRASGGERPTAAAERAGAGHGKRGPRGPRGHRGPQGPAGSQGPPGVAAGPARQFIALDWQNGDYVGHDRQAFVAPGIGSGEVRCTPPNPSEPTGVQWIRFYPDDNGSAGVGPSRWATTMWTARSGGNIGQHDGDPSDAHASVVRTARLDRPNQASGFHESMNTQTVGYDVRSTGMFTGLITTEPFSAATAKPPSTSFRLTWHWNFGLGYDNPDGRCYVAATFVTKGT